jgi:hypothetical protein
MRHAILKLTGAWLALLVLGAAGHAGGGGYYYPPLYYGGYSYAYRYENAGYAGNRYYPAGWYAYVPGVGYYLYGHGYYAGQEYTPPALPSYKDPGWRSKVIDVVRDRDEAAAYANALKALGVTQPTAYANPAFGSYGASGSTGYGYTYETLRSAYGETNLNSLYQQAGRLTQGAQQLAGQAHTEFSGLVQQAGDSAGRVAEQLARGQAAAQALRAAAGQSVEATKTTVIGGGTTTTLPTVEPTATAEPVAEPNVSVQSGKVFLERVGLPKCGSCHGQKEPKGGFSILDYPTADPEKRQKVLARLFHPSPEKRMPQTADGKHVPLSAAELKAFIDVR